MYIVFKYWKTFENGKKWSLLSTQRKYFDRIEQELDIHFGWNLLPNSVHG